MNTQDLPKAPKAPLLKALAGIQSAMAILSALLLLSMMAVTVVDTCGRYFLNHPVSGAAEWVELTMGIMVFAGLFQAAQCKEHVRIDLLDRYWSPAAEPVVKTIACFASMVVMLFLAWQLWNKALELHDFGDVSSYLGVPLAPVAVFMALMILLSAATYLFQLRALHARVAVPPLVLHKP